MLEGAALALRGVSVDIAGVPVLRGVSLSVPPGAFQRSRRNPSSSSGDGAAASAPGSAAATSAPYRSGSVICAGLPTGVTS